MKPKIMSATMPWAVLRQSRYLVQVKNRNCARLAKQDAAIHSHKAVILRNVTIAGEVVR